MRFSAGLLLQLVAASTVAVEPAFAAERDDQQPDVIWQPGPVLAGPPSPPAASLGRDHDFTLRHIYHRGSHRYPNLHRKVDINSQTILRNFDGIGPRHAATEKFTVSSRSMSIERMQDRTADTIYGLLDSARIHGAAVDLPASAWTIDDVEGPNVTDRKTVLSFARMAANAYITEPWTGDWEDVRGGFNYTEDFGWEDDGLRGHIFADTENSTVVIGLKGTSPAVFDGADTTGNDKLNDNLFGSCCCGQGGQYLWKQVCDCMTSTYTCNSTCLVKSLREKSHYYHAAMDLYYNVTERYPDADIWMTGHSLGGVVSSLLGLTFGLPTITIEAYPDALAASRLGLPTPPGYHVGSVQSRRHTGIYHVGHTADPIYMGSCNAASSACTIGGYALQSQCHTGSRCEYDTVKDFGWRVGIGNHKIGNVVKSVIEKYDDVPECKEDVECADCFNWKFYESNSSETTTSIASPTTTSKTRTATCQTPGWWGCLDESTTVPTTTMTSTITSTTCLSPGWFGCKEESTTTETTTITSPSPSPAPTITTTSTTSTSTSIITHISTSCASPGWFGCKDPTATVTRAVSTPQETAPIDPDRMPKCIEWSWAGACKKWKEGDEIKVPKCVERTNYGVCKKWELAPPTDHELVAEREKTTHADKGVFMTQPRCVKWSWYGSCKEWEDDDGTPKVPKCVERSKYGVCKRWELVPPDEAGDDAENNKGHGRVGEKMPRCVEWSWTGACRKWKDGEVVKEPKCVERTKYGVCKKWEFPGSHYHKKIDL